MARKKIESLTEIKEAVATTTAAAATTDVKKKPARDKQGRSYATGKRKNAVARVWIMPGKGKITINEKPIDTYFARPVLKMIINQPFEITNRENEFDVVCTVQGGGLSGQAGAIKHGISKALNEYEPELRPILKQAVFLTRDDRVVERCVLPPWQRLVRATRAADVRPVAPIDEIVQPCAVGRERALRHTCTFPFRHKARRPDDGIHGVEPATGGERRLKSVRAERKVAVAVRVPGGRIVAATAERRSRLIAARPKRDALGLWAGRSRVETPKVEAGPHHHRMAVRGDGWLERRVLAEGDHLAVGSFRQHVLAHAYD